MRLKIISFFLSLLIMVQVLPVEKTASMLANNQCTEELPHTSWDEMFKDDTVHSISFTPSHQHRFSFIFPGFAGVYYLHISEQIPPNHSADIVSPPPDVI